MTETHRVEISSDKENGIEVRVPQSKKSWFELLVMPVTLAIVSTVSTVPVTRLFNEY